MFTNSVNDYGIKSIKSHEKKLDQPSVFFFFEAEQEMLTKSYRVLISSGWRGGLMVSALDSGPLVQPCSQLLPWHSRPHPPPVQAMSQASTLQMTVLQFPPVQTTSHFVGVLHVMLQFPPEKKKELILYTATAKQDLR